MKAERWQRINDLFQSAAERAPEERAAFLDGACHGDEALLREVTSLIASYERAQNFIESPAFEVAPELLTDQQTGAMVGESIAHYRIESLIGVGGMGEVYLARDERLGRKVALKFLPERLMTDKTQLSRFKSEARSASALNHPNILTVYEIGWNPGRNSAALLPSAPPPGPPPAPRPRASRPRDRPGRRRALPNAAAPAAPSDRRAPGRRPPFRDG